jgi:hypothetical protein
MTQQKSAVQPGRPGSAADRSREARLKAALKANMARRKAQTKARHSAADDNEAEPGSDAGAEKE